MPNRTTLPPKSAQFKKDVKSALLRENKEGEAYKRAQTIAGITNEDLLWPILPDDVKQEYSPDGTWENRNRQEWRKFYKSWYSFTKSGVVCASVSPPTSRTSSPTVESKKSGVSFASPQATIPNLEKEELTPGTAAYQQHMARSAKSKKETLAHLSKNKESNRAEREKEDTAVVDVAAAHAAADAQVTCALLQYKSSQQQTPAAKQPNPSILDNTPSPLKYDSPSPNSGRKSNDTFCTAKEEEDKMERDQEDCDLAAALAAASISNKEDGTKSTATTGDKKKNTTNPKKDAAPTDRRTRSQGL